jgi:hypothetical protein
MYRRFDGIVYQLGDNSFWVFDERDELSLVDIARDARNEFEEIEMLEKWVLFKGPLLGALKYCKDQDESSQRDAEEAHYERRVGA